MDFFDTQAGYNFTNGTIPSLIESIDRLNSNLEKFMEMQKESEKNQELPSLRENLKDIGMLRNLEKQSDALHLDGYMDNIKLPNGYNADYILSDSYVDFVNGKISNMEWKDKSDQLIMSVRLRNEAINENIHIGIKASDVCKFYDNYILDFNKLHANQIFADLCHDKHYFNDRIDDMVETYHAPLSEPLYDSQKENDEYDER